MKSSIHPIDILLIWGIMAVQAIDTSRWYIAWFYFVWGMIYTVLVIRKEFSFTSERSLNEQYQLTLGISLLPVVVTLFRAIQLTFF